MKTKKRLLVGLLALVVLLSLTLAFVACTQKEPEVPPFTPQGEEAVYYRDGANGEETIELKNGNFVLKLAGDNKSGTYKYAKGSDGKGEITLTFSDSSNAMGSLNVNTGVFEILYGGTPYSLIKKVNYVVSYDVDGGSSIAPTETLNGRGISRPADPTKAGYIFAGWYTDAAKTTAYNFKSGKITADTTLYAKFVEKTDGTGEFTVQLINGESVLESRVTNNGLLHNLPELQEDGKVFLGWWISDSRDASKLTRQYTDSEKIEENTNLYAVWAGDTPAISVYNDKIVWNEVGTKGTVYHYSVNHTGGYLETTKSDDIVGTSFNIDFSKEPIGEYEISVTVNGKTSKAYYVNKGLARVSLFEVHGNDLVFNKVANATEYFISVKCGDPSHKHEEESLGESSTYNFANCQIGANGYEFTVKATAEGYVESVSDVFVYNRSLGQLTGLTRDTTTETLSWTKVEGATSYIVRITVGGETVEKTVYTESIFMGDYRGDITAEVISVAFGYQSTSEVITYTNTRLPAPTNIKVSGSTITWDAVEGATGYVVSIDGKEFATTTNSMTMSDQHFVQGQKEYKISIRANASNAKDNSMYSEEFTAKYGVMGDRLSYENNVLSWDAVFGAVKYVITINAGTESQEEIEITDGSISAVITWPKAGENTVSVYCVDKDGEKSTEITIKVTTYEIKFETGENAVPVEPMYKAIGDEYELPEAMANGLAFQGWYDNADYQSAKRYDDKGIMTGNMVVYAGWTKEQYVVTLDVGELGTLEEEFTTAKVIYGEKYVLPVPKSTDSNKVFAGWYTEPRGAGRRYTDQTGASIGGYPQASGRILYASWVDVFEFTVYNNPNTGLYDSIAVSAGPGISFVTEITIPSSYTGTLTYLETYTDDMGNPQLREVTQTGTWKVARINSNAFKSCTTLVKINIPSTLEWISWSGEGAYHGDGAFSGCSKIEAYFVYDVNDPTKEAVVDEDTVYWSKDGVLYINDAATGEVEVHSWPYNKQGSSFTLAYGVTNIPQYTFRDARFEVINLSASVRKLNKYSFYYCTNLKTIVFLEPEEGQTAGGALELTSGDNVSICYCNNLKTIVFPKRLKAFDADSIKDCISLSAILIGTDGNAVGDNYASIVYTDDNNQIIGSIITNRTKTTLIYVPRGFLGIDLLDDKGNDIGDALRIPNGISTIASNAIGGTSAKTACKFTHIYIPGTVTVIEENAFSYCQSIVELIFEGQADDPDLKICSFAFSNCTGLTEITLPANLTVLEECAFAGTSKLTTVYVEVNRPYVDFAINAFGTKSVSGGNVFYVTHVYIGKNTPDIDIPGVFGDSKLSSVEVDPDNMFYRSDEEGVVYNRSMTMILYFPGGKTSYVIPATITRIGSRVFAERDTLQSVVIPASVREIGENAFDSCDSLTSVTFTKTASGATPVELTIKDFAFMDCYYLNSIEIPARTTSIGTAAFRNCTRLTSVTFEESTSAEMPLTIGAQAFYSCGSTSTSRLENITLPDRTTEIGNAAFYNCQYLKSINIPASVTKMGYYVKQSVYVHGVDAQGNQTVSTEKVKKDLLVQFGVFENCYRLESINVDPANKYFMSIDGVLYFKEYIGVTLTGNDQISAEESQKYTLLDENFYDNTDGTAKALLVCPVGNSGTNGIVTIPNTVMALWYNAFYNNGNASFFSAEVGVREIKFSKDYIENARENKLEVGNKVFYYCKKLQSVSLPRGINTLATEMFYYCQALETIVIPSTVERMQRQAFYSCSALNTLVFEETPVGETPVPLVFDTGTSQYGVFHNCSALTTITLPERTTSIEKYAFSNAKFAEVGLPSTLETIKDYAFGSSTSLKKVYFPNGIQTPSILEDGTLSGLQIWDNAFRGCSRLAEIELAEGITDIGYYAFYNCTSLQEINLPATLMSLGNVYSSNSTTTGYVFYGCSKLQKVTFASGCRLETIPASCFYNCRALTSIEIPASIETIESNAFKGCATLQSVTFAKNEKGENNLASIGDYAFESTSLTSFAFPDSTASKLVLGVSLFNKCEYLTKIYLSKNIAEIENVFKGCESITDMDVSEDNPNFKEHTPKAGEEQLPILVSKNDESIKFVFSDIVGEFRIPDGFILIEEGVFKNQALITNIIIPETMIEIAPYAFSYCTGLKTIEFLGVPQLKTIGKNAFEYTESLKGIKIPGHLELDIGSNAFRYSAIETLEFMGTVANIGTYAFANTENLKSVAIPNYEQLVVGNYAFQKSGIASVEFKGQVKSLGTYLFQNCVNLSAITGWPSDVTATPAGIFAGCSSLEEFTIPKDVETIGNYMFGTTTAGSGAGIKKITIPSTVETIGTYMFSRCVSLEEVIFEPNENITQLGNQMFSYCESLKSVDLSPLKNLDFLGTYTFQYSGLEEFVVPNTVKTLNNTAGTTAGAGSLFLNCKQLQKVEMHDDITVFGNSLFEGCDMLTTITTQDHSYDETPFVGIELPGKLVTMGNAVFKNCVSIAEVKIPDSVATLGNDTFNGCTSLTKIEFAQDSPITSLGNNFARNCTMLTSVNFEALSKVTYLGTYSFAYTALTSVKMPDSLTGLSHLPTANPSYTNSAATFYRCTALKEVDLNNVVRIGGQAFLGCYNLETLIGLENQIVIGNTCFSECGAIVTKDGTIITGELDEPVADEAYRTGLKSVKFGANLARGGVGKGIFTCCYNLQTVEVESSINGVNDLGYTGSTSVGDGMFSDCTALTTVILPNSITSISMSTFSGCTSLPDLSFIENTKIKEIKNYAFCNTGATKADLSKLNTLTTMGTHVFKDCVNLAEVRLPVSLTKLNNYVFQNCTSLADVTLPLNITEIGNYAFENSGLTDLDLANYAKLTKIGNYAFRNCMSLKDVVLSDSVTQIGNYAFYGSSIKKIVLSTSLTKISQNAFMASDLEEVDWTKATKLTEIGSSAFKSTNLKKLDLSKQVRLTKMGSNAFAECQSLQSVVLPEGLTKVDNYTFNLCKSLASVSLPSTLTTLGNYVFTEIAATSFTIPAKLTTIGRGALSAMYNLKTFTVDPANTKFRVGNFGELIQIVENDDDQVVFLPGGFTGTLVVDSGTTLGQYAFMNSQATGVELPEGMMKLLPYALAYYPGDTVKLPSTLREIGSGAFWGSAITAIEIPSSVNYIGGSAFASLTSNIDTIVVPSSVTKVGVTLFQDSTIDKIYFNAVNPTYLNISGGTLSATSSLNLLQRTNFKYFEIAEGNTSLPRYVLANIQDQTFEIKLPKSLQKFEYFMQSCKGNNITINLQDLTVAEIGANAFYNYLSTSTLDKRNVIEELVLPSTVKTIGDYAFNGFDIGRFDWNNAKVTTLGSFVFQYSKLYGEFTFPETVTSIANKTFYYGDVEKIIFPATLQNIGKPVSATNPKLYDSTFERAVVGEVIYAEGITVLGGVLYSNSYSHFYNANVGKITLPSTLTDISDYFFAHVTVEQLVIPEGVTMINQGAFYGANIQRLYLPSTLVALDGNTVFKNWTAERTIYCRMSEENMMSVGAAALKATSATVIYDFDGEIPEVVWPPVEEETPEEEPTV